MLADELDYVVGVDTHRDEHLLAALLAPADPISDEFRRARESVLQKHLK